MLIDPLQSAATAPEAILTSEVLTLYAGRTIYDICERIQHALRLPPFNYGGGAPARWGETRGDGVDYYVVRHTPPVTSPVIAPANVECEVKVILLLRSAFPGADDPDRSGNVLVPRIAGAIAEALDRAVTHSTTLLLNGVNRNWERCFPPSGEPAPAPADWYGARSDAVPPPEIAPPGWGPHLFVTTDRTCRPEYAGPLDFAFLVHPRGPEEKVRPFPEARGLPEGLIDSISYRKWCFVISRLAVEHAGRVLHGELLTIPFTPMDMLGRVSEARQAIDQALEYARRRETRVLGLGGLLPALTRYGARLVDRAGPVGVTTGHGFTALAIADYVTRIEEARGPGGPIAVVGAAGSTGKAAVRCLLADRPDRRLILVELSHRVGSVPVPAGYPGQHRITCERAAIRDAAVVICVTNAPGSTLSADDFAPGCVILDDAQPENVTHADLRERRDLTVVKCLARVAGLRNPFDFGLFAPETLRLHQELTFTCLAETVLLAATGHVGSFTVGDPSDEQLAYLRMAAPHHGIGIAPFYSFPEIGFVELGGRTTPRGA